MPWGPCPLLPEACRSVSKICQRAPWKAPRLRCVPSSNPLLHWIKTRLDYLLHNRHGTKKVMFVGLHEGQVHSWAWIRHSKLFAIQIWRILYVWVELEHNSRSTKWKLKNVVLETQLTGRWALHHRLHIPPSCREWIDFLDELLPYEAVTLAGETPLM